MFFRFVGAVTLSDWEIDQSCPKRSTAWAIWGQFSFGGLMWEGRGQNWRACWKAPSPVHGTWWCFFEKTELLRATMLRGKWLKNWPRKLNPLKKSIFNLLRMLKWVFMRLSTYWWQSVHQSSVTLNMKPIFIKITKCTSPEVVGTENAMASLMAITNIGAHTDRWVFGWSDH